MDFVFFLRRVLQPPTRLCGQFEYVSIVNMFQLFSICFYRMTLSNHQPDYLSAGFSERTSQFLYIHRYGWVYRLKAQDSARPGESFPWSNIVGVPISFPEVNKLGQNWLDFSFGKLTYLWKITILNGKSTIKSRNGPFSKVILT